MQFGSATIFRYINPTLWTEEKVQAGKRKQIHYSASFDVSKLKSYQLEKESL